ncbi:MAG: D-aminoacylase, partial [Alphaproteobacteria bacterium]|nr:D-aminoacylase [Alphaproteobacteria bacterium]
MHDIVIRGGTIVDGTGQAGYQGDVAIVGDRLAQVGGKAGPGRREVDADGQLVLPGWIDVHTHYDGQATWDPILAPSSWHGATTVMFGNCGVGFAPCRPADRAKLIDLMEGVEDIPGIVLAEGLKWDWESFPEYLDALERVPRTIDIAAQVPHHPIRFFVMGERALRHEPATADEIGAMRRLTEEGLRAGAFGFTTSRTDLHRTYSGSNVPAYFAQETEFLGIGQALAAAGRGAFGMLADFVDEAAEFAWIKRQARDSGRPVWFLLTDRLSDPQRWRRLMAGVRQARGEGLPVAAQVACRPVGLILGLLTSLTPFSAKPSFAALAKLDPATRLARLRDPAVRERILHEESTQQLLDIMSPPHRFATKRWDRLYILGDPPDYEPGPERSVEQLAAGTNRSPAAYAYDYLTAGDGTRTLFFPVTNYVTGDHEPIRAMLTEPGTVVGLSDGGAHCGVICDASMPTFLLTHWARDRNRGEKLPLEWLVRRQTFDNATFFGFGDRGRLAPGLRADINVVDYANLRLHAPELAYDLPAGGRRFVQRVDG